MSKNKEQKSDARSCSAETPGYAEIVATLREMTAVQCNDGNWNYSAYMHGMANGMIFALSLFDDKRPEYLEAPEVWLEDVPNNEKPVCVVEA